MPIDLPLASMTVAEKIQLLEAIWDDLCTKPGDVQSPEWHQAVLAERTRRLESGKVTVSSWDEAKARLLKLGQ